MPYVRAGSGDTVTHAHTPGPWTIEEDEDALGTFVHAADVVARIDWSGRTPDETEQANARLIAAAPDLLAALGDCADLLGEVQAEWALSPRTLSPIRRAALVTIRKATGADVE